MNSPPYRNRFAAGKKLAGLLHAYRDQADALVIALPRGGVPVAYEIARALDVELDVVVVRKLGLPHQPERVMGAIASGGVRLRNTRVIMAAGIPNEMVDQVEWRECRELQRREKAYRGNHSAAEISDRRVILVDDGLVTGSKMHAAVCAVRKQGAAEVIVAVPVAPPDAVNRLRREADVVFCPLIPKDLQSVGQFYEDFPQLDDQQVCDWLHSSRKTPDLAQ